MIETLPFTLHALRAAYADGLSPTAVMHEVLRRIDLAGDPGIFLSLFSEADLTQQAEALGLFDADRPLWGVPFAVKDNIDVGGLPTTAACPAFAYAPETDASVVARLRAAGAIPVGKTNLDQFATGLVGVRTPYGAPKNAIDPAIVPGGSSSGSAVAVARGIVAFSLGTDTAGSGRVPAALNNIVGLKPSLGALSTRGVVPACRTLDAVSIFAMTVDDAHSVYEAASAYDVKDPYSLHVRVGRPGQVPPGLTAAIPDIASRKFFGDDAQAASFEATCRAMEALGVRLREIDFQPFYDVAEMLYAGPWVAERHTVLADLLDRRPDTIDPTVRKIVASARGISATDAFRAMYRLADLRRLVMPVIDGFSLLVVPSIPTFYSVADLAADPVGPNSRLGTYTNFVNLLGLCALTVPVPARGDGRPGSVTLIGRDGEDAVLASLGCRLEQLGERQLGATRWNRPNAAPKKAHALPDEIELAVCGAHMSGLPLNTQITSRGGRFLRATTTSADYRLFALPGGPPERPGLLRVARGEGSSIDVEVWALPKARVGDFLLEINAPLGIGTIVIEDGATIKGFLCEAAAVPGSKDITHLGGWRTYLAESAR